MNVFVAGGTGAIGRYLVPLLAAAGHTVVALTRSADRAASLASMISKTASPGAPRWMMRRSI